MRMTHSFKELLPTATELLLHALLKKVDPQLEAEVLLLQLSQLLQSHLTVRTTVW